MRTIFILISSIAFIALPFMVTADTAFTPGVTMALFAALTAWAGAVLIAIAGYANA